MNPDLIVLLSVVGGGFAGHKIGMPAGVMVAGLLAGLVAKGMMKLGLDPKIEWLSWISQVLVAYVLVRGSDFASIKDLGTYMPAAISYSILLFVFTLGMAWIYSRVFGMDLLTSLFATSPGGLTGTSIVAVEIGANATVAVLFNICRIAVILIVVPILASFIAKH